MAIINKLTNNKCSRGCGEKGALMLCWWGCRLVQPLWEAVWSYLKKIKNGTAFWPSNPTSGNISKEIQNTNLKECMHPCLIAVLFTIAKIWKQPKCPSVNEWLNKSVVHLHNGTLLICKREGNLTFCKSMHSCRGYYAKWNKLVRGRQVLYNSTRVESNNQN